MVAGGRGRKADTPGARRERRMSSTAKREHPGGMPEGSRGSRPRCGRLPPVRGENVGCLRPRSGSIPEGCQMVAGGRGRKADYPRCGARASNVFRPRSGSIPEGCQKVAGGRGRRPTPPVRDDGDECFAFTAFRLLRPVCGVEGKRQSTPSSRTGGIPPLRGLDPRLPSGIPPGCFRFAVFCLSAFTVNCQLLRFTQDP